VIKKLQKLNKDIGDSKLYKLWLSPLINVLFAALGNTAGIWIGYILIKSIFSGIWVNFEWPGINKLINEGVLLIISFSFLTSVLYQSTRRMKINFFNIISTLILVVVAAYYARVIAIEQSDISKMNDEAIHTVSLLAFWISLILLYISLVYEKYVLDGGDVRKNRNSDYNDLKDQVG
jgi:hypothetical protein